MFSNDMKMVQKNHLGGIILYSSLESKLWTLLQRRQYFIFSVLLGGGSEENLPTKAQMSENSITLDDFLPILWTISQAPDPGSYEDFFEGLKVFDKDGNGNVNSAELRHVLSSLGEKLTNEEIDILLKGQEDANGNVNYDKFIKTLMSDREAE